MAMSDYQDSSEVQQAGENQDVSLEKSFEAINNAVFQVANPLPFQATEVNQRPAIKRWYDIDPALSQLVHTVEHLDPVCQKLFARLLKISSERLIKKHGREFSRNLNWETYHSILKSRRSRRWYDQEQNLHKAFNTLLSLNEADRAFIGRELNVPAQIIAGYESYCKIQQNKIKPSFVQAIIDTWINKGPERVLELYSEFLPH